MLNLAVGLRTTCCARIPPMAAATKYMSNTTSSPPPTPPPDSDSTAAPSIFPAKPSTPIPTRPATPPILTLANFSPPKLKAVILGANGKVGRTLSFLLAQNQTLTDLNLYDLHGAESLAVDISHTETPVRVTGFVGPSNLKDAIENCDIVVCCAGMPRNPEIDKDDFFQENAQVVYELMQQCALHCPSAKTVIITEPINSIVPVAAEVFKTAGIFKPNRLFGVVTLDVVRANSILGQYKNINPRHINCTVAGGHTDGTCVPVFSQCIPNLDLTVDECYDLSVQVNDASWGPVRSKEFGESSVSMGYAGARFVYSLIRATRGEDNVMECAFVPTDSKLIKYFTSNLILGVDGFERSAGISKLTKFEKSILKRVVPIIRSGIVRGEMFIKEQKRKKT